MVNKNRQSVCLIWILLIFILILLIPYPCFSETKKISKLFQQVNKSVVLIYAFGRDNLKPGSKHTKIEKGVGSGVVISKDGLIMTASHVVHIADRVIVKFLNGKKIDAEILSTVPQADVALLKIKKIPKDLSIAELGDSDTVLTGEKIFVVGAPYGIDHTLSVGYVSGRLNEDKIVQKMVPTELLQIDAAVNPGNSGGPVFNMDGQVIGIVSHILSRSGGFEGLGFCVTINAANKLLIEKDYFWSGIEFRLVDGKLASALNIPQKAGLLIQRVAYESSADKTGLKPGNIMIQIGKKKMLLGGDVILQVNSLKITEDMGKSADQFKSLQEATRQSKVTLKVFRKGKVLTVDMVK
ncbi:MAG: trypsin-like serine protease [Desulfobacteraceae bacterium]|nr:trypsin-like serine protease [Desulfobacteraceae bacterium]